MGLFLTGDVASADPGVLPLACYKISACANHSCCLPSVRVFMLWTPPRATHLPRSRHGKPGASFGTLGFRLPTALDHWAAVFCRGILF